MFSAKARWTRCRRMSASLRFTSVEKRKPPDMLSLANIHVSYDGSRILRDVSLTVAPGEVVCLMGRNGVGKTTTLKAITGLVKLDSGSIKLAEAELAASRPEARARHGLGYVPQGRDIFPNLTV